MQIKGKQQYHWEHALQYVLHGSQRVLGTLVVAGSIPVALRTQSVPFCTASARKMCLSGQFPCLRLFSSLFRVCKTLLYLKSYPWSSLQKLFLSLFLSLLSSDAAPFHRCLLHLSAAFHVRNNDRPLLIWILYRFCSSWWAVSRSLSLSVPLIHSNCLEFVFQTSSRSYKPPGDHRCHLWNQSVSTSVKAMAGSVSSLGPPALDNTPGLAWKWIVEKLVLLPDFGISFTEGHLSQP